MRLYISGPITSNPDGYRAEFGTAATLLTERGYQVYNPAENPLPGEPLWADYMRRDIGIILGHDPANYIDGIALLPGWHDSRGASLEVEIARALDIPVRSAQGWELLWPEKPVRQIQTPAAPKPVPATDATEVLRLAEPPAPVALAEPEPAPEPEPEPEPQLPPEPEPPSDCNHRWQDMITGTTLIRECPDCGHTEMKRIPRQ